MPPSLTSFRSLLKWQLLREDFPDHWLKTAPPSLFLTLLFFTAVTSTCCCLVAKLCLTFLRPYGLYLTRLLCPDFPGKNTGMGCHFLLQDIFLTQRSNLSLLHCRQSLYHWAAWEAHDQYLKVKVKSFSRIPSLQLHELYSPWNSPGQDTGVGSLSLLQGIFLTPGSNPGLPHCRQIVYQLSHQGSPRILEWAAYPFSRRSSWPRNWTRVSCIAGGFFTNWAIMGALDI